MHTIPVNNPAAPTGLPLSRRSLLRGGTVLGLSAVATAGLASAPMATAALAAGSARTSPQPTPHANLVADYRPSQPTGWSPTSMPEPGAEEVVGMTVGGHTSSLSFPYRGVSYRLSLLSFGQPGDSADPVYEATPTDSTINFRQTLANKFGDYYSFNYVGGFKGQHEFSVQSYSVFVHEPTDTSPALNYGANLYFVYTPDLRRGDPDIHRSLQFVQVVNWVQANGSPTPASYVDCAGRANPFYSIGGLTSVFGNQVFSFLDTPQVGVFSGMGIPDDGTAMSDLFLAEVFLVQDTGTKDAAGKGVVNVFGGIKYGWQLRSV